MSYRVYGRIRRSDNGQGVSNLTVKAYDVDWISSDDYLGRDTTDSNGNFEIRFNRSAFDAGWFDPEGGPDIIIKIWNPEGHLIYTTSERSGAGKQTYFDVRINPADLIGLYLVSGIVRDARSQRALCNLKAEAWDDDFIFDNTPARMVVVRGCQEIEIAGTVLGPLREGREIKVMRWIADELTRAGIGRFHEDDMLDRVSIHKIHWREIQIQR